MNLQSKNAEIVALKLQLSQQKSYLKRCKRDYNLLNKKYLELRQQIINPLHGDKTRTEC